MSKTTADQHVVLFVNGIPPEQKNGFLRCSAYFQIPLEQTPECPSSNGKSDSDGGASFCCAVRWSHLSQKWHSCGLLPPCCCKLLCGGFPPPRGNPGLKRTRTYAILKKFNQKVNFKLKINVQRDRTNFRSIQLHHLQRSKIS
jgi:hypothetical protein